jgi:hypothetical protein
VRWEPETADAKVGSFMPALRWACEKTTGPILELGGGYFSTSYLHGLSEQRYVVTYEFDPVWRDELSQRFASPTHTFIGDFGDLWMRKWAVCLVDCEGWSRQQYFARLVGRIEVFVLHDTQDGWIPEQDMNRFRYRHDMESDPKTTLLSNHVDVTRYA